MIWKDKKIYVPQNGKVPLVGWKDPANLMTMTEALNYDTGNNWAPSGVGILVPEGYIVLDMDNAEDVKRFDKVLDSFGIRHKIATMITTKGKHYWLRINTPFKGVDEIDTPFGWTYEVKLGGRNLVTWVLNGSLRQWDNKCVIEDTMDYKDVSILLTHVRSKKEKSFYNESHKMGDGDGRQLQIYKIAITLTLNGHSEDIVKRCCGIIDRKIFLRQLTQGEFEQQVNNGITYGTNLRNSPDKYRGMISADLIKELKARDKEIESLKAQLEESEGTLRIDMR